VPVLIVLNVIGLVTTWSRGGAVIFLVTLMAIVVEYRDRFSPRTLGLFLGGAGVAVVVVLLLIPPSYWERQKSVTDTTDVPMARRGAYLSLASEVVPKHPVLGWGPDSFQYLWAESSYARKYQRKGDVKLGFRRKAHNTYIEVIVGTGVLGLAAFLSILGCAFRDFTKARRIHLERGNRAMAHLVGSYRISLFALCVYLFVYSDVYHKYLLLSLALSQVALRLAEQGAGATPDDRLPQVV
jgi:O-antigen ligase